jgi:hypothetical protein
MALSPREARQTLGLDPGPVDPAPTTAQAAARSELDDLNGRLARHVATRRRDHETPEQAMSRVLAEEPALADEHDRESRAIVARHKRSGAGATNAI